MFIGWLDQNAEAGQTKSRKMIFRGRLLLLGDYRSYALYIIST